MNTIHSHPQKHRNSDNYSWHKKDHHDWSGGSDDHERSSQSGLKAENNVWVSALTHSVLVHAPFIASHLHHHPHHDHHLIIHIILINTFITVITLTFIDIFILINLLRSTDSPIFRIHFGWNSKNLHSTPKLWLNVRRSCKINQNQPNIFIFIGPSPIIAVDSCH